MRAYENYTPTLLQKILRLQEKEKWKLLNIVQEQEAIDRKENREAFDAYEKDRNACQRFQNFAKGITNQDTDTYFQIIQYFKPFDALKELGTGLSIEWNKNSCIANITVDTDTVIPSFVMSQTQRGNLSKKPITKTRFNELYQDYVCSCILRVAREIDAHFPFPKFIINALIRIPNPATGHLEDTPIVSLVVEKANLKYLNFQHLDPSESMSNFNCLMNFSKLNGFKPVSRLPTILLD